MIDALKEDLVSDVEEVDPDMDDAEVEEFINDIVDPIVEDDK